MLVELRSHIFDQRNFERCEVGALVEDLPT